MRNLSEIRIVSFGHKYGPAPAANLLFDVRFLRNPYYVETLRPLTGLDRPVQDFFANDDGCLRFLDHMRNLLASAIEGYSTHGHDHDTITIAFGCTGGKHRSVYFACRCADAARELVRELSLESRVVLQHRDLGRE